MTELFRSQAIAEHAQHYGTPLGVRRLQYWVAVGILTLVIAFALGGLMLYRYPRWEAAGGVTVYAQPPTSIASPYPSVINRVLVSEGQMVEAGQPLVELRARSASENPSDPVSRQRQLFDDATAYRIRARDAVASQVQSALNLTSNRRKVIASQSSEVAQQLRLRNSEETKLREFIERLQRPEYQQVLPRVQVIDYESRWTSIKSEISSLNKQMLELTAQDLDARKEEVDLRAKVDVADSEASEYVAKQEADKLTHVMTKGGYLFATEAGTASNILVRDHREVDANESIMTIVPADSPIVGALLLTGDQASFVSRGSSVRLRFKEWNFRTRGEVQAHVRTVSSSPLYTDGAQLRGGGETAPLYRVVVDIEPHSYRQVTGGKPLLAGMKFDFVLIKDRSPFLATLFPEQVSKDSQK